jgi:hypothetical protein
MVREDWYRHLARINRLIAETRERIERLKVHISELENADQSTGKATARLHRFEVTLQLMGDHRAAILKKVRSYPLPCGGSPPARSHLRWNSLALVKKEMESRVARS